MSHSETGKARRGYPENNKAKDGSSRYARDDVLIPKSFRAERSEVEESRKGMDAAIDTQHDIRRLVIPRGAKRSRACPFMVESRKGMDAATDAQHDKGASSFRVKQSGVELVPFMAHDKLQPQTLSFC